jgi:hypothetical protein
VDESPCCHFHRFPPKLGQAHLQFPTLINLNFSHSLTEGPGAAARAENLAFQSSRLLAVVVDVAIFLPLLQVYGSAPPHLFSTVSRCFCAASAAFCRPGRRMTCITWCGDRPCRRRAYAGPSLWGRACSALGCICFDFDWWMATSGTLERGQPRQMTGTWSAAWEGLQRCVWGTFASRFWKFGRAARGDSPSLTLFSSISWDPRFSATVVFTNFSAKCRFGYTCNCSVDKGTFPAPGNKPRSSTEPQNRPLEVKIEAPTRPIDKPV